MSEHSVNVLTDGQWVPVGGIMRWQGTHLAQPLLPPKPQPVRPSRNNGGVCVCGAPTYSDHPYTRYCLDCQREARRLSWRNSGRRRAAKQRGEVA